MAVKIYFTSLKGGTGVTSCCIGIGKALADAGERTLIVDGDNRSGGAMIASGCRELQVYTLADYERGACRAKQTIVLHPHNSNLGIMPALGLNNLKYAESAVNAVDGLFDYILLDKIAQSCCNEAVIVTEPFLPSLKSADCCRAQLSDGGIKNISLIVNKLNGARIINGETGTAQEISAALRLPLKAVIPEDLTLPAGKYRSETEKAFIMAAKAISGKDGGICNVMRGYRGLNGYIKRKIRSKI